MISRNPEIQIINNLLLDDDADLMAITGRRRVGKTYLIRHVLKKSISFEFIGTQHASADNQLEKFAEQLTHYSSAKVPVHQPENWSKAFRMLEQYLGGHYKMRKKKVVVFDEFPWMDTHKSGFLSEFSYWWNSWASRQNILVVICGSSASWMIRKVLNDRGGLHNRVTKRIHLMPFTLSETRAFLHSKKVRLNNYHILQLYMVTGGIPLYLEEVISGESATQMINRVCFSKNGLLNNEFKNLYAALYKNHTQHIVVIKALVTKWKGLTRQEIIKITGISDGGGLSTILEELEDSDFIIAIRPYGKKKKDMLYRLIDEYSIFYLKFIEDQKSRSKDIWMQISASNTYKLWAGYAFENICIKHSEAIMSALGISGVYSNISSYAVRGDKNKQGLQIDMLIDRADNTINICEMKYYNTEWTVNKQEDTKLRHRREYFRSHTSTKKLLLNTIITTYGITYNEYSTSQIDNVVTLDALFGQDRFNLY